MIEIKFVENYLKKFISKAVILKLTGIINMNININNFKFLFKSNKLMISEKMKRVITISFDEVDDVEKNEASNVIRIIFNINEKITIKLNE